MHTVEHDLLIGRCWRMYGSVTVETLTQFREHLLQQAARYRKAQQNPDESVRRTALKRLRDEIAASRVQELIEAHHERNSG